MRSRLFLLASLLVVLVSIPAFAQKETGVILGTVTDSEGLPMPGVTVTVSSPALIGGSSTAYTDAEGNYRFPALPPGVYSVAAELQGFQKVIRREIRLYVGNSFNVSLTMEAERMAEAIEVSGEAPLIDSKTAAMSKTVPVEAVENLPKFSFALDLFTITPGVGTDYVAYGGGGSSANSYWVDGVDVSDPEGGTPWLFPNYNWLQEVQVVGIGAPAEYGGFTGVVANSITRSGGNEFSGLFETFYNNNSTVSDNIGDLGEGLAPPATDLFSDTTIQLGGPIQKDKFWFFTGFQYFAEDDTPAGYAGTTTERDPRIISKLTYKLNQNNTLQGFFEWDRYDIEGRGADASTLPEATVTEKAPEVSWNATLISLLSPETVLDVRFSGFWGYYYLEPMNGTGTSGHFDGGTGLYTVNSTTSYFADRQRYQLNASVSHYARDFINGDHDFKFGMEFERSGVQSRYYYNGGIYYYDYYGAPYSRYLWNGYDIDSPLHRTSVFAQDSWSVNKNLTFNLGLRWDHNRGFHKEIDGAVFKTDPIAPRLGFTYDLKGDQQTVIKGHYGRYYEAMLSDYFGNLDPDWDDITKQYYYYGEWITYDFIPHQYIMDPDIKQPYIDQWTIGVDKQLPGNMALGVHYIDRKWKDIIDDVDTRFETGYGPVAVINPVTGETITGYSQLYDPATKVYLETNVPDLYRKYKGLEITANKRLSKNLYLSGSFMWSEIKGNAGNSSYGSSGNNTGIYSILYDDPNYNINIDGRPANDPTYEWKFQGIYNLPYGINTSWYYRYSTGDAWQARVRIGDDENGNFNQGRVRIFGEPRGHRRLSSRQTFDLRLEKEFPLGKGDVKLTMDIFNLFNTGYVISIEDRYDVSSFESALEISDPRVLRFGVRYAF